MLRSEPLCFRRRFWLAGVMLPVLTLGSQVSAAPEPGPPGLKGVRRIVTLGDSITQGGGRPGGYVWLIDHYLQVLLPERRIEVVNAGISGHKSNDMLARFQRDVLDKKPDLVTISVGINDVWHGFTPEHPAGFGPRRVPLAEYTSNVEYMLAAAEGAGVRAVLFTTTIFEDHPDSPRNRRVDGYNAALRRLAEARGLTVADQNAAFWAAWKENQARQARLTTDQVHLGPAGNELMARTALLSMGFTAAQLDQARPQVLARLPK